MNDISKNVEKVGKYIVLGLISAGGLNYTMTEIPIEFQIIIVGLLAGLGNFIKHQWKVSIPFVA